MAKHCFGLLFSHVDPSCVGKRSVNQPSCGLAAQCASKCDQGAHVASEGVSWAELNAGCVAISRKHVHTFDLAQIELVIPSLQEGL